MDPTYEYLWAAGYDLPPEYPKGGQPLPGAIDAPQKFAVFTGSAVPRRGKKAAKAKRQKAAK